MATFQALPPELQGSIFKFAIALPNDVLWPSHPRNCTPRQALLSVHHQPDIFRAVCRTWKAVAESTPQLWRYHVGFVWGRKKTMESVLRQLGQRIGWARNTTGLSLLFYARSGVWYRADKDAFVAFFSQHACRFRHLHLDLDLDVLEWLAIPSSICFPSVDALSFDLATPILQSRIVGVTQFPKLASLRLYKQTMSASSSIDWSKLVALDVGRFYEDEVLQMLQICASNLVHFRVSDCPTRNPRNRILYGHPIVLPRLETFDIGVSEIDLKCILPRIVAPRLRRLRCHSITGARVLWVESFEQLVTNSGCEIEMVIIAEGARAVEEQDGHLEGLQSKALQAQIVHVGIVDYGPFTWPSLWEDWEAQCQECFTHYSNGEGGDSRTSTCPVSRTLFPGDILRTR